jgi:hypothetical protein
MKKKLLIVLLCTVMMNVATGCGDKSTNAKTETSSSGTKDTSYGGNDSASDTSYTVDTTDSSSDVKTYKDTTPREPSQQLDCSSMGQILLDGVVYQVGDLVDVFEANGWSFDIDYTSKNSGWSTADMSKGNWKYNVRLYPINDTYYVSEIDVMNIDGNSSDLDFNYMNYCFASKLTEELDDQFYVKSDGLSIIADNDFVVDENGIEYESFDDLYYVDIDTDSEGTIVGVIVSLRTSYYSLANIDETWGEVGSDSFKDSYLSNAQSLLQMKEHIGLRNISFEDYNKLDASDDFNYSGIYLLSKSSWIMFQEDNVNDIPSYGVWKNTHDGAFYTFRDEEQLEELKTYTFNNYTTYTDYFIDTTVDMAGEAFDAQYVVYKSSKGNICIKCGIKLNDNAYLWITKAAEDDDNVSDSDDSETVFEKIMINKVLTYIVAVDK